MKPGFSTHHTASQAFDSTATTAKSIINDFCNLGLPFKNTPKSPLVTHNLVPKNMALRRNLYILYSRKQEHVSVSDMSRVATPQKT